MNSTPNGPDAQFITFSDEWFYLFFFSRFIHFELFIVVIIDVEHIIWKLLDITVDSTFRN